MAKPMPLGLKVKLAAQREACFVAGTASLAVKIIDLGTRNPGLSESLEDLMKSMTEANSWANHLAAVQSLWDEANK